LRSPPPFVHFPLGEELAGLALGAQPYLAGLRADGEIIRSRAGPRSNPAIKTELEARSFVVRTLQRLGLNFEPTRTTVSRPPNRA
jgi:hypothetical protein